MDYRVPVGLIAAALLAYFTYRAQGAGEAMNRFSTLHRSDSPRLFVVMITMRWVFVAVLLIGAVAAALGWLPPGSN